MDEVPERPTRPRDRRDRPGHRRATRADQGVREGDDPGLLVRPHQGQLRGDPGDGATTAPRQPRRGRAGPDGPVRLGRPGRDDALPDRRAARPASTSTSPRPRCSATSTGTMDAADMSRLDFAREAFAELSARAELRARPRGGARGRRPDRILNRGSDRSDRWPSASGMTSSASRTAAVYASGVFGGEAGIGQQPGRRRRRRPQQEHRRRAAADPRGHGALRQDLHRRVRVGRDPPHPGGDRGGAGRRASRSSTRSPRTRGSARPRPSQRFEEKMPNWNDYSGERDGYDFADEIAPEAGDIIIVKPTASSFYRTDLEDQLRAAGHRLPGGDRRGDERLRAGHGRRRPRPRAQGERGRGRGVRPGPGHPRHEPVRHAGQVRRRHPAPPRCCAGFERLAAAPAPPRPAEAPDAHDRGRPAAVAAATSIGSCW